MAGGVQFEGRGSLGQMIAHAQPEDFRERRPGARTPASAMSPRWRRHSLRTAQRDPGLLLEVDQRQVGQQRIAGGLVAVRLPGPDAGDERFREGEAGHGPGGAGQELVQQPLAAEPAEDGDVERRGELRDGHGRGRGLGLDRDDEAARRAPTPMRASVLMLTPLASG